MFIKKPNYFFQTEHLGVRRRMGGGWEVFAISNGQTYQIREFDEQEDAQRWLDYAWDEMSKGTEFLKIE